MFDAIDAMTPGGLASQVVAWLLTYTLHSTLFLSLAWLASRRLAQRMPAVEEAVWRFALVAGLITASLQLAAGREPLTGSWSLGTAAASTVSAPVDAVQPLPRAIEPRAAIPAAPRSEAAAPSTSWRPSLSILFGGAWLAGALLLGGSWLAAHARLRRRLRPRPQVLEATMVSLLGALRERAGLRKSVRLSCSSRLPVPVALGVRRPEICVPPRALVDLAPEQQEGLLAHELAHLVRRDPFWLAFGRLLASVLFFQPLNWIAVRRLREISELLCDEWAVGRTGRPVSLARCLAEVAGWSIHPVHALPAPGMADRPSHLGKRIRRLLEEARSPQRRVHPVWLAAGMVILVVAVAAAAPGVRTAVAGEAVAPVEQPSPVAEPDQPAEPEELSALDELDELDELGQVEEPEELAPLDELDFADHLDAELSQSLEKLTESSMQLAMDRYSADTEAALAGEGLSEEEAEKIAARYEEMAERISEQVSKGLEPRMEELGSQIEKQVAAVQDSEEMRQLQRRAQEIAERSRPSEEEMAKIRADIEKLRAEGGLSAEDKRKIREEARRVAQEHRMTAKDRAEIDEIQRQAREMAQRSVREHQAEIDQLRQQIEVETRAMREEIRRQLENDPEIRALRERRHQKRDHEREHLREDRERERRESTTPRPPHPEHHVHVHVAPEARIAPAAMPTPRPARPAIAPVAPAAVPTPRPGEPAMAPVAPMAVPTPRPGRPAAAPVAVPTPRPGRPAVAPVAPAAPAAEPTPEPSTPTVAPEPPR